MNTPTETHALSDAECQQLRAMSGSFNAMLRAAFDRGRTYAGPGQWVACTPELIRAGVDCAATPRRPGKDHSHDHFIAHGPVPHDSGIVLLPCLCGQPAQTDFIEGESYLIECLRCEARTRPCASARAATTAWNRRQLADPHALPADLLLTRLAQVERDLMLAMSAARHEARNADHWKANHDQQVARCALLAQREDLPVDRLPAYRELVRLQEILGAMDAGPWYYHAEPSKEGHDVYRHYLESDDFTHDVRLYLSGDFGDEAERERYAQALLAKLNRGTEP